MLGKRMIHNKWKAFYFLKRYGPRKCIFNMHYGNFMTTGYYKPPKLSKSGLTYQEKLEIIKETFWRM